jgi:hypothetical protein
MTSEDVQPWRSVFASPSVARAAVVRRDLVNMVGIGIRSKRWRINLKVLSE